MPGCARSFTVPKKQDEVWLFEAMPPKLIFKDLNLRLILLSNYSELNPSRSLSLPQTQSFSKFSLIFTKAGEWRSPRVMTPHNVETRSHTHMRTRAHAGKSLSLQRWRTVSSQSTAHCLCLSFFTHGRLRQRRVPRRRLCGLCPTSSDYF